MSQNYYKRFEFAALVIAGICIALLFIIPQAFGSSIINGKTCVLVPSTSNYVEMPGMLDCYTGQDISKKIEANSGNTVAPEAEAVAVPIEVEVEEDDDDTDHGCRRKCGGGHGHGHGKPPRGRH